MQPRTLEMYVCRTKYLWENECIPVSLILFLQTRTTQEFVKKLECYLEDLKNNPSTGDIFTEQTEAHIYSGFTYDAVWMIAYALDKAERELGQSGSGLTLEDFKYFEANNISNIIAHHLAKTNFSGVSVSYTLYCVYMQVCSR